MAKKRTKPATNAKEKIAAIQEANQLDQPDAEKAVKYLAWYGYLNGAILSTSFSPVAAVVTLTSAVLAFQEMAGLPLTGQLDKPTMDKMSERRCGVLDFQRLVEFARWRKNRLTYRIESYLTGISKADQDDLQEEGWKAWTQYSDVSVTRTMGSTADITVKALRGRANGFDGPSGVLAWCYLPTGNDGPLTLAFDADENYMRAIGPSAAGILYGNVDKHEKGHAWGLEHSRVPTALMAPFYSERIAVPQANDDISRFQSLYGPPVANPTPNPNPNPNPPGGGYRRVIQIHFEDAALTKPIRTIVSV